MDIECLCPICLEDFSNNAFVLNCSHLIHLNCCYGLISLECPICRSDITNFPRDLENQILQNGENHRQTEMEEETQRLRQEFLNPYSLILEITRQDLLNLGFEEICLPTSLIINNLTDLNFHIISNCLRKYRENLMIQKQNE